MVLTEEEKPKPILPFNMGRDVLSFIFIFMLFAAVSCYLEIKKDFSLKFYASFLITPLSFATFKL